MQAYVGFPSARALTSIATLIIKPDTASLVQTLPSIYTTATFRT